MKHLTKPHTLAEIGIPLLIQAYDRKADGTGLLSRCESSIGNGIGR
jgi:hypothetical protein